MAVSAILTPRRFAFCLLSLLTFCSMVPAWAQPTPAERAQAEALFEHAVGLMEAGKATEACPKLEESQRLDPGVGTLLYLAECYRTVGRTASAWGLFLQAAYAAKDAGQPERQRIAEQNAEALKPQLSYLVLTVPQAANGEVRIERNGEAVGPGLIGVELPVDPGEHRIVASADGKQSWSGTVTVPAGPGVTPFAVPELEALAEPEPLPPPAVAVVQPPPATPPPPPESQDKGTGSSQAMWGWISMATGGAALVGGGVFAALAASDDQSANDWCRADDAALCNERGVELGDSASSKATVATVLTGVGAALAATGLVLVLTAPDDAERVALVVTPRVASNSGSVLLKGEF